MLLTQQSMLRKQHELWNGMHDASVCHERGRWGCCGVGDLAGCGAVQEMKVWPFGVALRGETSNRLKLRWLKTVVVSVEEKAHVMRQVGTGKASVSEPLTTCRNKKMTSKPGR
ncbi:hypothetical protein [Nonomuraea sp. NPDC049028]|uniref:hypothetical protein n=1 Tax=Nonomuraea sp. NPDC049028 TaxID=3364348 RepID=UPI003711AFA7